MQEWVTGVDQPHLTIHTAEQALLAQHNIAGEEALTSETPHTTHHTGQADRDTTQAGVGSVQETRTTESDTRGTRPKAGAPQTKKRAHSSTNNKRNNKKAHKGKENKTKRKQKSRTSILWTVKTPRAHAELHLKITLNSAPQRESTLHRRLHEKMLLTVRQSPTANECELHGTEKRKNLTFDLVVNRVMGLGSAR